MPFSFLPRMIYPHLTDVRAEDLTARGVSFLMLDFDNTIVPYTTSEPTPEMAAWLGAMQASGIGLCVVSNSKKPRVVTFCKMYGLDCVTHAKKPFQKGISECLARFHLRPETAALVGDQIFTDRLAAGLYGISCLYTMPRGGDHQRGVQFKRRFEPYWLGRYYQKGGRLYE